MNQASQTDPPPPPPVQRRLGIALLGLLCGAATLLIGLGLGLIGMGFANATACGTGIAAAFVGGWMILGFRGISQARSITITGLALAWLWLVARVIVDLQPTAASGIVLLFFYPLISVPLGLVWFGLSVWFCVWLVRWLMEIRRERRQTPVSSHPKPTFKQVRGLVVRLIVLVVITLSVPRIIWSHRGQQIEELAQRYALPPAEAAKPVTLGACTMVFLGYELTQHGNAGSKDPAVRQAAFDRALGDAEAEVESIVAAGARYVRMGASGDQLLESKPEQEAVDDRFMAAVRRTGLKTVLVDTQHPKVTRDQKLSWDAFCKFQRNRIEYYMRRDQPDVYFVVCEPMTYHHYCLSKDVGFSPGAWAQQLSEMCHLVKSIRPSTRTGICLLVGPDREAEWEVWTRMKALSELDILSVEIYGPEQFAQTEERLRRYGHPRESGKAFWIAETFNGWALSGVRQEDQDAAWLRVAADFARRVDSEVVLVWSFGSFVPGGSFMDIGNGRLKARWDNGHGLSKVGRTFAELAKPAAVSPAPSNRSP